MNVKLPDGSALELPDGASALDAARAIGPKLAEQAVLARVDGEPRDLRLPLPDGASLEILTTRDHDDPDALSVLRHSSAHLLAEAVRRLHPGVKVAIGPAIDNGFYYDFEFPEPIREEDLAAIEAEMGARAAEGSAWTREAIGRDDARARFEAEGERYKVELVDSRRGRHLALHAGRLHRPLPRAAPAGLEADQGVQADRPRGRLLARRRANTQLTRVYGTAFFTQADLDAHLERLEQAKLKDHRRLGPQLDLFHMSEFSPGAALWTPKGMAIWNALEDLRRRENARRGYLEVKTPIMWDVELWKRSGHWDKYGTNLFRIEHGDSLYASSQ